MKLFKKLAAAMLVAALALTMVGCGGRNSLTDQIKDVLADFILQNVMSVLLPT